MTRPPTPGTGPAAGPGTTVGTTSRLVAIAALAGAALTASFALAGPLGLVIAADAVAAVALLITLAATPARAAPPGDRLRGVLRAARGRIMRRWRQTPVVQPRDFPAYRKISSDLGWAPVSRRHYDHGTRPLLVRLMQAALAERQQPGAAPGAGRVSPREMFGRDLWPLIDPSGPLSQDSNAPGVDLPTLTRIVDRLEQL